MTSRLAPLNLPRGLSTVDEPAASWRAYACFARIEPGGIPNGLSLSESCDVDLDDGHDCSILCNGAAQQMDMSAMHMAEVVIALLAYHHSAKAAVKGKSPLGDQDDG